MGDEVENAERRVNKRVDGVEQLQKDNAVAIGQLTANITILTKDIASLRESTQGIVDVWSAGRTLQKAVKWLSGFSFIAIIIAWATGKIG